MNILVKSQITVSYKIDLHLSAGGKFPLLSLCVGAHGCMLLKACAPLSLEMTESKDSFLSLLECCMTSNLQSPSHVVDGSVNLAINIHSVGSLLTIIINYCA